MQEINHKKGKIYYSMGEVAEMFDVNPSLLRFWEQEFDILRPHRNKKGNRLFTPADVDNIRIIYHLLKEKKMKIEVARKQIKDFRKEINRDAEITEHLMNIRAILLEVKQDLLYDGEIIDEEIIDEDITDDELLMQAKGETKAPSKQKDESDAIIEDTLTAKSDTQDEGLEAEVSLAENTPDNKPPFEEQKLFDVAVPLELLQKTEEQNRDEGFESAKNAFEGINAPEELNDIKPRPQAIEQTLF